MTADEFFLWWRAQLAEIIPASLRGSWHNTKTSVLLSIDGNSLELSTPSTGAPAKFDLTANEDAARPKALQEFLSSLPGSPQRIRLNLAPAEYLSRQLTLPRAAKPNLAEAVRYQLPQLTPFSADQLLYACGEHPDSPADGPLSVWLVAIPRERVARALRLIGQSPPDSPLALRHPPAAGEPLALSWRVAETSRTPQHRKRLAWVGLIGLLIGVITLHFVNRQQEQAVLDSTLDEVRSRAVQVGNLRDRLTAANAQTAWLDEHKQSSVSTLALLNELAERLDDKTWLQGLELQGRRVTMRGISSSPATLIETLEASQLLKDVRFESAITRDNRGQGDRFNISAEIELPTEGGGA